VKRNETIETSEETEQARYMKSKSRNKLNMVESNTCDMKNVHARFAMRDLGKVTAMATTFSAKTREPQS